MIKAKNAAFTLVELLIVMTIMGILTVLLFRTYTQTTQVSTRVASQTMLSQWLLETVTILERLSQESRIAFDQYDENSLSETWVTKTLYLSQEWNISALTFSWQSCGSTTWNDCQLYRDDVILNHPRLHFSQPYFVLTPTKAYTDVYDLEREEITAPWRRFYAKVHLDSYTPELRTLNASHTLQLFFRQWL